MVCCMLLIMFLFPMNMIKQLLKTAFAVQILKDNHIYMYMCVCLLFKYIKSSVARASYKLDNSIAFKLREY